MTERTGPGLLDRLRAHNAGRTFHTPSDEDTKRMIERWRREGEESAREMFGPRWNWTEIDYLKDDIERLRAEIGAAGKPKRQRRRSATSYAKTVVKTGVTITTPDGATIKPPGAESDSANTANEWDAVLPKGGKLQ